MWELLLVFTIVGVVAFLFVRSLYRKSIDGEQGQCGKGCCNATCPFSGAYDPTKTPEEKSAAAAKKKNAPGTDAS